MSITVTAGVACPLCNKTFGSDRIGDHIQACLTQSEQKDRDGDAAIASQLAELREQRRKAIAEINTAFNELERKQTAEYHAKIGGAPPTPTPGGLFLEPHWLHAHEFQIMTPSTVGAWTCDSCRRDFTGSGAGNTRRRCASGCDYDLCSNCWALTPGTRPPIPPTPYPPFPTPIPTPTPLIPTIRPRAPGPNSLDCKTCWDRYGASSTGAPVGTGMCDGCNTPVGCVHANYCPACSYRLNRCQTCRAQVAPAGAGLGPHTGPRPIPRPEVAR